MHARWRFLCCSLMPKYSCRFCLSMMHYLAVNLLHLSAFHPNMFSFFLSYSWFLLPFQAFIPSFHWVPAGDYTGARSHHYPHAVSGLDCVRHHSPVSAVALHLDWARHHPKICLPDRLLDLLPLRIRRHHSAVAGVSQDGELHSSPVYYPHDQGLCSN